MTRNRCILAGLLGAGLLVAVVLPGTPRAVAVPAGLLLALVLPGAAATAALFTGRVVSTVERLVLVPALSLAVLVLGGLGLYACGVPLVRWSWAALAAGATALGALVAYLRRRRGAGRAGRVPPAWQRTARHLLPLAVAAALLGGAGWVSVASAHAQWSRTAVVALSMTTADRATTGTRTVTIAVRGSGTYRVRVTGPDGYDRTLPVTTSGTWHTTLSVPAAERVTAQLFRTGDTTAYRTVYLDGASALAGT
jgi:hypothetical protein